jgi:hypothetical protein
MRDKEGVSQCELAMVAQMPHLTTRIRDILRPPGTPLPAADPLHRDPPCVEGSLPR